MLRLRTMEGEPGATLTVKYREGAASFKLRRETEVRVDAPGAMCHALEAMGFRVVWFYEKIRESWRRDACHVVLDELPLLGCFLEVEGPDEEAIARVLRELAIDPDAHLEESYIALFRRYCRENDLPFGHLRFAGPPPIEAPAP